MTNSNRLILTEIFSTDEINEIKSVLKSGKFIVPWKYIKHCLEINPSSFQEFQIILRGYIKYRANLVPRLKKSYQNNLEKNWITLATMWKKMIFLMT